MKVRMDAYNYDYAYNSDLLICLSCGKDSFKSVSKDQREGLLSHEGIMYEKGMGPVTRFYECLYCHSIMRVCPFDTVRSVSLSVRVNPPKVKDVKKKRVRRQWTFTSDQRIYKRMKKVLDE